MRRRIRADSRRALGSAAQMSGLPALFVYRPYFPGEILEFEIKWDYEEAAIQAADGGPGILALAAESVVWRWMTGPRQVEEPPRGDGAEVNV